MNDTKDSPRGFLGVFFREVWEFAKIVLLSLAIVLPIRLFIAQPFIVRGASMIPTFQDGEYLIVDELSYFLRLPQRGEVIVFRYPQDPSQFFIKRIIGLPGETVIIDNGAVMVKNSSFPDGFLIDESYLSDTIVTAPNSTTLLDNGEYFVMGDNRLESSDSRRWGVLEADFLIGRALLRLWPLRELGIVTNQ
ncbi:MAG: signal peptidase I [Parcubacteria group bacterium Gr01-1014_29]|nr:MAG: signal peptidase I [Parcubacteria group bacterium Gr01-1014_29]